MQTPAQWKGEEKMPEMFKKHPDYMGNDLTLNVGGGDKKVTDDAVLEGPRWRRYARQGFLKRMSEQEVEKVMARREGRKERVVKEADSQPAPKKEEAPKVEDPGDNKEPENIDPVPQPEDPTAGMTKSPASSYDPAASATSTSTKKRSSGKKGSKKSDDES